eukprot:GHVT01018083.1.p1 GENE.GHVT01018083.1~~GHVT01018083.1.p1  ORF type:complete len:159 (+),score=8.60 GHVT01018083.1:33-479(+)
MMRTLVLIRKSPMLLVVPPAFGLHSGLGDVFPCSLFTSFALLRPIVQESPRMRLGRHPEYTRGDGAEAPTETSKPHTNGKAPARRAPDETHQKLYQRETAGNERKKKQGLESNTAGVKGRAPIDGKVLAFKIEFQKTAIQLSTSQGEW